MLSALPTDLASIQMTLTTKAAPPQASCWDLKALVLCLSAGPSLEGLDQKELGGAWTERLRGGLRPLSQVLWELSRGQWTLNPHGHGSQQEYDQYMVSSCYVPGLCHVLVASR